ncbi:carboxymuconolactone decarboxylase family protein [Xenophilus azovorans]|uniref:carboxymuconolactone decarboxylase family protein n=1 Tax=Xenophilus azovorans TaxID=151755 RepID=UPI00056FBA72|nr:carboxymuconolactone decarboxylase family protein [Xenophilus azovorans]
MTTTVDQLRARGLEVMRSFAGEDYAARREASANDFNRELRALSELAMGSVWARPDMDRATRSLVTVAMLTALGRQHELTIHMNAALNNGCTPAQLKEVILHAVIYCGFPAANEAARIAEETFRARGIAY